MHEIDCSLNKRQMAPAIPQASFRLELTSKEIGRLVHALDQYIVSNGDLIDDKEVARYEDLKYRFMGLPDTCIAGHAEGRRHDAI